MQPDDRIHIGAVDPETEPARQALRSYYNDLECLIEDGFDPNDASVAHAIDLRAPSGRFLVAFDGDTVVGGGGVRTLQPAIGEIKHLWVDASHRGRGLGKRLLQELEDAALELGIETIRLDTNRVMTEAMLLYRGTGYQEIRPYNRNPYAHHWFHKRIRPTAPHV